MPRPRRRSLARGALGAACLLLAGCATTGALAPGAAGPAEVRRALLERNPGLVSLRAVVEARFSFGGRSVSLPGVLLLESPAGFRLDLLDPLDRPVAVFFGEEAGIVQYRPAQQSASALGLLPAGCRAVSPGDWAGAVLSAAVAPFDGESDRLHAFLGARTLERSRAGALVQSVRYAKDGPELRPETVSWYCGEDPVLQLRFRGWRPDAAWRLPARIEVLYPGPNLAIRIDLKEVEANPAPPSPPLQPRLPGDTRWYVWNLPR
jgi:hypothetical protein